MGRGAVLCWQPGRLGRHDQLGRCNACPGKHPPNKRSPRMFARRRMSGRACAVWVAWPPLGSDPGGANGDRCQRRKPDVRHRRLRYGDDEHHVQRESAVRPGVRVRRRDRRHGEHRRAGQRLRLASGDDGRRRRRRPQDDQQRRHRHRSGDACAATGRKRRRVDLQRNRLHHQRRWQRAEHDQ
jgi:hypothetical protein